jgi:autotransporter-associated beta strand protein
MQTIKHLKTTWFCAIMLTAGVMTASAQTATWIGGSGGEWSTAAGWDLGVVPGVGTNACIDIGTNVNYNLPMAATTFGEMTNGGVLNINTNGFNNTGMVMTFPGGTGKLLVNNGGAVNVTGNLGFCSNSVVSLAAGSSLAISGSLIIGSTPSGSTGTATLGAYGSLTNYGGTLTAATTTLNPGNASISTSCLLMIRGGTNNLGAYAAARSPGAANTPPALGTDGLVISNGFVNTTSISIGNNAHGIMFLVGGTVTNTGTFTLKNGTSTRPARFLQTGGLFVTTDPSTVIMSGAADSVYAVLGGTNMVGGFQFNGTTMYFTNTAAIYVGSQGMVTNSGDTLNAYLNSGSLLGATADWTGSAAMKLTGGTISFSPADLSGNGHTITFKGLLSGSGGLLVTNAGTLVLASTNTYTAGTTIGTGSTLQLGDIYYNNGAVAGNITNNGTLTVANPNNQTIAANILGGGSLVKNGAGTLILGTNTYTGGTTISGGTLQLGDGTSFDGLIPSGYITNNATLAIANPADQTWPNAIIGSGSLVKSGAGTLTLTANETYAGPTTVNAGSLVAGAGSAISSVQGVTIAPGALLDVSAATPPACTIGVGYAFTAGHKSGTGPDFKGNLINNGTLTIPAASTCTLNGNLSLMDGGTGVFNLGSSISSGSTIALAGGALHLSGSTTLQINFSVLGVGRYPLISGAGSVSGNVGNLNLYLNGSTGLESASLEVTATGVNLVVTGNPQNLVWRGDGVNNYWDNNTANTDWSNTVTHVSDYFATGYFATFDDTGAANPSVILDAAVYPASVTVNGSASYTFSGAGISSGSLTNNSSGILHIQNANTYGGETVINAGTVEVDSGGALGTGPVVDNAALVFEDSGNSTAVISGSGSVTVTNYGYKTLSAANTYAGGTTVASGAFLILGVANAIPGGVVAGDVTVNGNLNLAGFSDTVNGLSGSGIVDTYLDGTPTLTVGANGDSGTFNGIINNSIGTVSLVKTGSGSQILGNVNTYSGGTTIANGTLGLAVDNALPTGTAVTLGGNGTAGALDLGGFSQEVTALAVGSGAVGASQIVGNSSTTSASTLIYSNVGSSTFGGTIQDVLGAGTETVALAVSTGSLILTGTNTYSGGTTIGSGTNSLLRVNGGLLSGTTLTMNSINGSKGFLLTAGTASFSGNVAFSADNANNANSLQITGGVFNAGSLTSGRSGLVYSSQPVTGTNQGIYVAGNAVVNITNALGVGGLSSGANSSTSMRLDGGTVNVGGTTTITLNNGGRWSVLDVNGGTFASTDATGAGIQIGGGFASASAELLVRAGTVSANTITLGDLNQTNGTDVLNLTGGTLYVGSGGIVSGSNAPTYTETIALGTATVGARGTWSSFLPMTLTGTVTFQAADGNNNPYGISLNGALSGSAVLNKTGGGTLTLGATNTYSGLTLINGGTLALGANGALASLNIMVETNAIFDVSPVTGGFTLKGAQTLKGFGSVAGVVTAASGATIDPGSNALTGTLTFTGGLTENGGANQACILSGDPAGLNNDLIRVSGPLTVSGVNYIQISGSLQSGGVYPLISYAGGTFSGSVTNFTVSGASGSLSNSTADQIIYFVALGSARAAANVTWLGDGSTNNWDVEVSTNWLNAGTGLPDFFVPGDSALFSDLGATNPLVHLMGTVTPASITVNTASNYTFTGTGSIGGEGSLTVSRGTVTMLTTNSFTGPTLLNGGTLVTPALANGGIPSGLGAAATDPTNLVFDGGTLNYLGVSTSTDHGMTLTNGGGTIGVTNGTALTLYGTLTGNGALTKVGNGTLILPIANSYTGNTAIGGGVLQLQNTAGISSGTITFSNGTLAYSPSAGLTVANPFSFTAGTTNMIIVTSGSGANPISGGNWSGGGTVVVSNNYLYTLNGVLDSFTGTILLAGTNTIRFNSGGGNTCFGSTNATFDLGTNGATLTLRNAGTMNLGALQGGSNTWVVGQGSDSGTANWTIGNNNLSTTFAGTIENSTATRISAVTKVGTGTLTLQGTNIYTGTTTIRQGTLRVNGGIGTNSVTVNGGAALGGSGTIGGAVTVQSGGSFAPGAGISAAGTALTINNNLTLQAGSTNTMRVSHNNSTNDSVVCSGTITYGGQLMVMTNAGDAPLVSGDKFTLFNATGATYSGSFTATNLPALAAGLAWSNSLAVDGSIAVISSAVVTPSQPAFSRVTVSGSDVVLNATGGSPGGAVSVLTATNIAVPIAQWTTVTTGHFDSSSNFNYTVSGALTSGQAQQFYILQAQ